MCSYCRRPFEATPEDADPWCSEVCERLWRTRRDWYLEHGTPGHWYWFTAMVVRLDPDGSDPSVERTCSRCGASFVYQPLPQGGRPRTQCFRCRPSKAKAVLRDSEYIRPAPQRPNGHGAPRKWPGAR